MKFKVGFEKRCKVTKTTWSRRLEVSFTQLDRSFIHVKESSIIFSYEIQLKNKVFLLKIAKIRPKI